MKMQSQTLLLFLEMNTLEVWGNWPKADFYMRLKLCIIQDNTC